MTGGWTRRTVLAAGLTVPIAGLRAAPAPRAAALDWGLAATLAALGAGPAAVAEQAGYAQWVRAPALPAGVANIGLRTAPSFEALAALKPDLILTNALNAPLQARLERIAPVYASPIFAGRGAPVDSALLAVRELGGRLGRTAQAAALAGEAAARFAAARARLAGRVARPLVPLGFVDGRHARIYGTGSLFGDVMARLDLASGWTRPTNAWGFSVVPIEAIAACRGTDVLVIQPLPREARLSLDAPGLWSSLVAASDVRVLTLPPVWAFGDITAAMRCADVLADALTPAGGDHG